MLKMQQAPPNTEAREWIEALGLQPHPEGGWFAESYRSAETIAASALPGRYDGPRCFGTSIYFMISASAASRMHCLQSDETWHFHCGSPLTLHLFDPSNCAYTTHLLDANRPSVSARPQFTVRRGIWFGATVDGPYALVGATVYPGFDFADFEMIEAPAQVATMRQHGVDPRVL